MIDQDLLKKADPLTRRNMVKLMTAGCLSQNL